MFQLLLIGLVYPIVSLVFGGIYFVCRWIYAIGYKKSPNARMLGGWPILITNMAMCIMGIVSMSIMMSKIPSQ